jgi:WD40 repeat protein
MKLSEILNNDILGKVDNNNFNTMKLFTMDHDDKFLPASSRKNRPSSINTNSSNNPRIRLLQTLDPLYHRTNRKLIYHRSTIFKESSGSIIDIAVDDNPSYFGINCMVASTAYVDPQYNRPGELLSISTEGDSDPIQCLVMNGHYHTVSGAGRIGGDRATTTCITYNKPSRLFFSGGYDGSIAIWDPTFPNPRNRISSNGANDHINTIVSHPNLCMGIFGTSTGQVKGFKFKNQEIDQIITIPLLSKSACSKKNVNTIEAIRFNELDNHLYVGIGMIASTNSGQVECVDINQKNDRVINSKGVKGLLTDIEHVPNYNMVLIGTGELCNNRKGSGYIEMWSHSQGRNGMRDKIHTNLYDVHQIKSCPSNENYVVISDTTSVGKVYDLRNYSNSLLNISHFVDNIADQECMVCHWLDGTQLLTGGTDGKLKRWDILAGNPLIDIKNIDSPISVITSGVDHMTLWIGTVSGCVHLYTPNKSLNNHFKNNLEIIF